MYQQTLYRNSAVSRLERILGAAVLTTSLLCQEVYPEETAQNIPKAEESQPSNPSSAKRSLRLFELLHNNSTLQRPMADGSIMMYSKKFGEDSPGKEFSHDKTKYSLRVKNYTYVNSGDLKSIFGDNISVEVEYRQKGKTTEEGKTTGYRVVIFFDKDGIPKLSSVTEGEKEVDPDEEFAEDVLDCIIYQCEQEMYEEQEKVKKRIKAEEQMRIKREKEKKEEKQKPIRMQREEGRLLLG